MLLVPAVVSLARWLETSDRRMLDGAWLAVAFFLLAAPLPYEDPALPMAGSPCSPIRGSTARGCSGRGSSAELWLERPARVADTARSPSRTSHEEAIAR